MLAALVLTFHNDPGRAVGQADRAFRFIDVLPARAGSAERIHINICHIEIHLNILSLRQDRDRDR